jgi:hypothetical protein|tara:strand:- start:622 stop:882 length:261 start_codon:yes stop_codon:yes gene_type:complete
MLKPFADEMLILSGLDEAIIGVCERRGEPPFVVYDFRLLVECFVAMGVTRDDAVDHVSEYIAGSDAGPNTWGVLYKLQVEGIQDED